MIGDAGLSPDNRFRWWLTREWDRRERRVCFVMLNPSTADSRVDDATIRRIVRFAQRWGYGGLIVVNLYPFRTKTPSLLVKWAMYEPNFVAHVNHNRQVVVERSRRADLIVAAWGNGAWQRDHVVDYVRAIDRPLYCLGVTADGSPKHPLARGRASIPKTFVPTPFWTP